MGKRNLLLRARASIFPDAVLLRPRPPAFPLRLRAHCALLWAPGLHQGDCWEFRAVLRVRGSLLDRQLHAVGRLPPPVAYSDQEARVRIETFGGIFWFAARFARKAAIFER